MKKSICFILVLACSIQLSFSKEFNKQLCVDIANWKPRQDIREKPGLNYFIKNEIAHPVTGKWVVEGDKFNQDNWIIIDVRNNASQMASKSLFQKNLFFKYYQSINDFLAFKFEIQIQD